MSAPDHRRARPRAFWNDARFLVGVALVVVSIAGVWVIVTASRDTVPVFAAAHTVVPGDEIIADDLRVVEVALGSLSGEYVTPDSLVAGAVAVRTVGEGELLPVEAVGDPSVVDVTTVVIRTTSDVPVSVVEGTRAEVWMAPPLEDGGFDTPRILVAGATVALVERDSAVIGGSEVSLELVVPRADVSAVLRAQADGSALSVVSAGE